MVRPKTDAHQWLHRKCTLIASPVIALWLASCSTSHSSGPGLEDLIVGITVVIIIGSAFLGMLADYQRRQAQSNVWSQIASQINATFTPNGPNLQHSHKKWTTTLDCSLKTVEGGRYPSPTTRIRTPFLSCDNFQFIVYPKHFQNLLNWPGPMPHLTLDIVSATDVGFDPNFIVKTNDVEKVKVLLSNPNIRNLLAQTRTWTFGQTIPKPWVFGVIHVEFSSDQSLLPEGTNELYLELIEVVTDVEQVKTIFEVFDQMLDILHKSGSASAEDPNFGYYSYSR